VYNQHITSCVTLKCFNSITTGPRTKGCETQICYMSVSMMCMVKDMSLRVSVTISITTQLISLILYTRRTPRKGMLMDLLVVVA
jgi:hypothetical protein